MMRDHVLSHLREAAEELAKTIKEIEADPEYDDGIFGLALNHAYHHLNTAWNARHASPSRIEVWGSHTSFHSD